MRQLLLFICFALLLPVAVEAASQQAYEQAIVMAAAGHEREAIARLQGAAAVLPSGDVWQERMALAAELIDMRRQQGFEFAKPGQFAHARLAVFYLREHARPEIRNSWLSGVLASVFPGAGHAWQGRWRDALVAVVMVWPMLILTLWAAYRSMGPVTVFFAMITAWLWSGTVFSAISLAERGDMESYLVWWQGLWQASGLPGRPW